MAIKADVESHRSLLLEEESDCTYLLSVFLSASFEKAAEKYFSKSKIRVFSGFFQFFRFFYVSETVGLWYKP